MAVTRRELFTEIVEEWLETLIDKDRKYGGDEIAGAIRDQQFIDPKQSVLARINEKWNRVKSNSSDELIIEEETFDIWGYLVIREAIKRLESSEGVDKETTKVENKKLKNKVNIRLPENTNEIRVHDHGKSKEEIEKEAKEYVESKNADA